MPPRLSSSHSTARENTDRVVKVVTVCFKVSLRPTSGPDLPHPNPPSSSPLRLALLQAHIGPRERVPDTRLAASRLSRSTRERPRTPCTPRPSRARNASRSLGRALLRFRLRLILRLRRPGRRRGRHLVLGKDGSARRVGMRRSNGSLRQRRSGELLRRLHVQGRSGVFHSRGLGSRGGHIE